MASVSKDKAGRVMVQFTLPNKKRCTLRLGSMKVSYAETVAKRVTDLIDSQSVNDVPSTETREWVSNLWSKNEELAEKLVSYGLIERRGNKLLGEFLAAYLLQHGAKQKPGTITALEQAKKKLIDHFGENKPLRSIDVAAADDFETYLRSDAARTSRKPGKPERGIRGRRRKELQAAAANKPKALSDFTIRRRLGMAKQFFRAAVRQKLIEDNPFADKVTRVGGNEARIHLVDLETFDKVLAVLPSVAWRTVAALARHGGLRCPSEIFGLRWTDVIFDEDDPRFIVRSSKTKHHAGGGVRVVPIFARLRPYIDAAYFDPNAHREFVVDPECFPSAGRNANLRTQFLRYLELARVDAWPRVFQNLRASRVNEAVREGMKPKEIEKYFGHTWAVSMESYQKVDEHDRKRWTIAPTGGDAIGSALQKALHAGTLPSVAERQTQETDPRQTREKLIGDTPRHSAQLMKVGPGGL